MLNPFFSEQHCYAAHPSADAVVTEYPCDVSSDCALDWLTNLPQITPDITCTSRILDENALGLSGMSGPRSVWSADWPTCPAATSISSRTDIQFSSPPFFHQPSPSNSVVHHWQAPPLSAREELDKAWETLIPHSDHSTTPLESPARKPIARLPSKHASTSQLLARSAVPRSRYTPYPPGPDSTRRGDSYLFQCRWFDGTGQCSAFVPGTKSAIGQHLKKAHAIRLKADKTTQVCLWEQCRKLMRGESIPRHILAVHMQDKVLCPGCESRFARTDSMQRHLRTCLAKREDAPSTWKWESEIAYH